MKRPQSTAVAKPAYFSPYRPLNPAVKSAFLRASGRENTPKVNDFEGWRRHFEHAANPCGRISGKWKSEERSRRCGCHLKPADFGYGAMRAAHDWELCLMTGKRAENPGFLE